MLITVSNRSGSYALPFQPGQTLLDALRQAGLPVSAPCGGRGTCGKCTVYLSTPDGERAVLACQTAAEDGMALRLLEEGPLAVELEGVEHPLPCPPDPEAAGWGLACDIGTTTVVCHLVELSTGRTAATLGEGNAQRPFGGDVIARIKASMEGQRPALTAAIRGQLSRMVEALCQKAGVPLAEVHTMAVAANTTMCHLLAGLAPDSLGRAPFIPLSRFGERYSARELELPFDGTVYIAPAVSGYVGGDITADLLWTQLDRAERPTLLIDVGTNGEMALGDARRLLCCSTAAGPAFEGAQISCGMTAAPGAISQVCWRDGGLSCSVVGGIPARGICGSGLIDAVAVMLDLGAIDETGRMLNVDEDEEDIPEQALPYLFLKDDEPAFRLAEAVYVTQADVRKLQLGKGAIAAGVQVLLDAYGVPCGQVGGLLLAGGFGRYIRPESAARIGLIPKELLPVTKAIGNAAAEGARAALVSRQARARLSRLQDHMEYLELSGLAAFNTAYMDTMLFPEEG